MTTWLLVPSPLLTPGSWAPVAAELTATGDAAHVPDLRPTLTAGPPFAARQAHLAAADLSGGAVVLAAFSGAGPLVPAVAAALSGRGIDVTAAVFVDAGLPHPGRSRRSTLPADLAARLDRLVVGGQLPPWPRWWTADELAAALPDPELRATLVAECPGLPAALFDEPLPDGPELVGGYLRLSAAYDVAAGDAEERGWPVARLEATHLAPLTRPGDVMRAMRTVLDQISPARNAARAHVAAFNRAVRGGDWATFSLRFADDALMRFTNMAAGPFVGRAAITQGYTEQPPDDTMTIRSLHVTDDDVRVGFEWDAGGAGTMLLRRRDGLVTELTITFGLMKS